MKTSSAVLIVALFTSTVANATDSICTAIALHSTTKTDDYPYPLKTGEVIDAITQYNLNKKTGKASFCSHGGGCYPAEALRLTNCTVDKSKPQFIDEAEISYGLDLTRSKVPPDVLRQHDVELKLLDLGMCNARADNAAAFYVKMPASRCAALVRRALEGDPTAVNKLKDMPDYCSE